MERINPLTTVSMLAHLANVMHGEGRVCGLSSAQTDALLYFAHANRFSRTVSVFAEFRATTRGTASQTIKSLVDRGLLVRRKSDGGGQRTCVDITEEGRSLLEEHDTLALARVVADLPESQLTALADALSRILSSIPRDRETRAFGPCSHCEYCKQDWNAEKSESSYFCSYAKTPLDASAPATICMHYRQGRCRGLPD